MGPQPVGRGEYVVGGYCTSVRYASMGPQPVGRGE